MNLNINNLNMLNAPTDNIYKFCAILGLIIMFSSSYYTFNKNLELKLQENNLVTETKIIMIETEELEKKLSNLNIEIKSILEETENLEYKILLSNYENKFIELKK